MTLLGFFQAARRAWYLACLGMVATCLAAWWAAQGDGVYWARTEVYFVGPRAGYDPNVFISAPESVIAFAGLIQRSVSGSEGASVVSDAVTLPQQGVEQGTQIRLPDAGGQWATNFNRPVLVIEAVDDNPAATRGRILQATGAIQREVMERQRRTGAPQSDWIGLRVLPSSPSVTYEQGDPKRAVGGVVIIGCLMTASVIVAKTVRDACRSSRSWSTRSPSPDALVEVG